jgi:hypothetical protein
LKKPNRYGISEEAWRIVRQYWNEGGAELRDYRDIDQHYDSIVRHTFLQVTPEEKLIAYLPDNPKERKASRVTFTGSRDALPYFNDEFAHLQALIDSLSASLGIPGAPRKQSVGMAQLDVLRDGKTKTLALVVEDIVTSKGMEIGQTSDRHIYGREVPAQTSSV